MSKQTNKLEITKEAFGLCVTVAGDLENYAEDWLGNIATKTDTGQIELSLRNKEGSHDVFLITLPDTVEVTGSRK